VPNWPVISTVSPRRPQEHLHCGSQSCQSGGSCYARFIGFKGQLQNILALTLMTGQGPTALHGALGPSAGLAGAKSIKTTPALSPACPRAWAVTCCPPQSPRDFSRFAEMQKEPGLSAECPGALAAVLGLCGKVLVSGRAAGLASVRCQELPPPCQTEPVADGSKTDLPLAKAETI